MLRRATHVGLQVAQASQVLLVPCAIISVLSRAPGYLARCRVRRHAVAIKGTPPWDTPAVHGGCAGKQDWKATQGGSSCWPAARPLCVTHDQVKRQPAPNGHHCCRLLAHAEPGAAHPLSQQRRCLGKTQHNFQLKIRPPRRWRHPAGFQKATGHPLQPSPCLLRCRGRKQPTQGGP